MELEGTLAPIGAYLAIYVAPRELAGSILSRSIADGCKHFLFRRDGLDKVLHAHDHDLGFAAPVHDEPLIVGSRPPHNLPELRARRQRGDDFGNGVG